MSLFLFPRSKRVIVIKYLVFGTIVAYDSGTSGEWRGESDRLEDAVASRTEPDLMNIWHILSFQ